MPDPVLRRRLVSSDVDQTRAVGARLGAFAQPGDVFLLDGDFGVGKTVFVQGLALGLDVPAAVTSPSFVIMAQHQGRLPLYHVDLYRLEHLDPEIEESVADAASAGGVVAVEWPGILPEDLKSQATLIRLTQAGERERVLDLETPHPRLADAFVGNHAAGH